MASGRDNKRGLGRGLRPVIFWAFKLLFLKMELQEDESERDKK